MANIDGGALSFKSVMENDQMNSAIEETLRRVQGLSDATVAGGKQMDKAFLQTADGIRQALGQIGAACEIHETELAKLEDQYEQLGREASAAFMAGRDEEARTIQERQSAIRGEITVHKQALEEARNLSNELEKEAAKREEATRQVQENAKAYQTLRSQIREVEKGMAAMIAQGERDGLTADAVQATEAYKALMNELGRLKDIQGDIARQGKILANDEAGFQGVIQGLSGLAGGFSAATGAISLFAGENENLQKVMTKVQSVMAIAMGMQSVAQTLNKDSAFMLVTVRKAKELLTVAELKFATALGISNVAAKALMATLTLGLSVAITAIIAAISHFSSKAREAKKAQEEFSNAMIEGCYKPIGKVEELSVKYNALGDDIKAKEKFIKDNQKAFDELGVSITSVRDAENLLINNKEAFIEAQIAKAKATIYAQQATEKIKELIKLQEEYDAMPDKVTKTYYHDGWNYTQITVDNDAKKKKKKQIDDLNKVIKDGYTKGAEEEATSLEKMKQSGINAVKMYAKGTVGAIKQAISEKQEALNDLVPNSAEWNKKNKEIEALQKQLEKPTKKTTSKSGKDPFVESKSPIMSEFEEGIKSQLDGIDSIIEKIEAIKTAKRELSKEDPLVAQKHEYLDQSLKDAEKQAQKETQALYKEYVEYYDKRTALHLKYLNDINLLENAKKYAKTDDARAEYQKAIDNRTVEYDKSLKNIDGYDEMIRSYGNFEQKKQQIIDSYEEKRRVARERDDEEMLSRLNDAVAKDISSLATEDLTNSDVWSKLFGNLDELTAKEINTLVSQIESNFDNLSKHFDPIDVDKIREKLNEAKEVLLNDNPFMGLGKSIKEIFNQSANDGKESARNIKKSWNDLANSTERSFEFVSDAINSAGFLKEAIGEVGETALSSLATVASTSIAVAAAIKTAEKASIILTVIQAALSVVQSVLSVVDKIAGNKDKKIDGQIRGHAKAVNNLQRAYDDLERSIDKALGGNKFKLQKDALANLDAQRKHLQEIEKQEKSKKKSDDDKISEYQEQQREILRKQEKIIEDTRIELIGLDAKDAAGQLGDAFIDAFARGEDAVKAFGKKVDEIVANIMRKMLIKKLLEEPMGNIIARYSKKWFDDKGNFKGFDRVIEDADNLGSELKGLAKGFGEKGQEVLNKISNISGLSNDTSLTGAIKGVTEETASVVAGYLNAIRMRQAESADMLRLQLSHLSEIANNTKYCRHLESIDRKLSSTASDALRSKGLSA